MYQREALWLGFTTASWKPNAVKIYVGNINAISGQSYNDELHTEPQDYIVCPDQPWLDGINTGHGFIRQFVAMPLGLGYTVEASITGMEIFGGIQIVVFKPKPGKFEEKPLVASNSSLSRFAGLKSKPSMEHSMGLGAGGMMKQKIYPDKYGIDVWDMNNYGRAVIHIVNSLQYHEITGNKPLPTPINAKTYTEHGLPWFELYEETQGDVVPSITLANAKTIANRDKDRGVVVSNNHPVDVPKSIIKKLCVDDSTH